MALCINQSGTWRNITTQCVNQSGTWRKVLTGCINQSGTWRKFGFAPALGSAYEGGFLICQASGVRWVVAPASAEVSRNWCQIAQFGHSITRAQQVSGCPTGWFVPTTFQQQTFTQCRQYWDSYSGSAPSPGAYYWTSTTYSAFNGLAVFMPSGYAAGRPRPYYHCGRAFRCVTY